jgi:hypothetical protein
MNHQAKIIYSLVGIQRNLLIEASLHHGLQASINEVRGE